MSHNGSNMSVREGSNSTSSGSSRSLSSSKSMSFRVVGAIAKTIRETREDPTRGTC